MQTKMDKMEVGSIVCNPNEPSEIYTIIEKLTVFDGFDIAGGEYSYGKSKTLARCKRIDNGKIYRFPVDRVMIYLGDASRRGYSLSRGFAC